jgi:hypothetical protein
MHMISLYCTILKTTALLCHAFVFVLSCLVLAFVFVAVILVFILSQICVLYSYLVLVPYNV